MPIPPERKSVVSSGDEVVPEKPSREPLKKYSPENEQNLPKVSFCLKMIIFEPFHRVWHFFEFRLFPENYHIIEFGHFFVFAFCVAEISNLSKFIKSPKIINLLQIVKWPKIDKVPKWPASRSQLRYMYNLSTHRNYLLLETRQFTEILNILKIVRPPKEDKSPKVFDS